MGKHILEELWAGGGAMEVQFLARLRDERKFEKPEALREQVLKDIEEAKKFHAQVRTA